MCRTCILFISGKKDDAKFPVVEDGHGKSLLVVERERAFGFPTSFTDGAGLSINDRRKMLGRAWCVRSMTEILSPLTTLFKTYEK